MDEARAAMGAVMDGEATPAQLAALLVALRMRGETVEELAGFASAMRERVLRVEAPEGAIDVVGTGGDGCGTFNISTAAALVVASTGVPVAKHGNRAITSAVGSADVLDALGVRSTTTPSPRGEALREHRLRVPLRAGFHPAMKHAGPTRREIGVRTAFNLIGPLTNPAGTRRADRRGGPGGGARGSPRSRRCSGPTGRWSSTATGVDELPLDGTGVIHDVRRTGRAARGRRRGARPGAGGDRGLAGGRPTRTRDPRVGLRGETGPRRDVVLLNAGAALSSRASPRRSTRGSSWPALTIDAGLGTELLERLRAERRTAEAAAPHGRRGRAGMTLLERPRPAAAA